MYIWFLKLNVLTLIPMSKTLLIVALCACSWLHAQKVVWKPQIPMGGQLFPAYLLATATADLFDTSEPTPFWLGDPNGMLGIEITNPLKDSKIKLEVRVPQLTEGVSVFEGVLGTKGEDYLVFPDIKYDYVLLGNMVQPKPVNATFTVFINGKRIGEQTKRVAVRALSDCPYAYTDIDEQDQDISWMFAAFVNENHPVVDQVLKEALATKLVNSISGYQGKDPAEVYKQVFAIWTVFQNKGIKYSSITRASGESDNVISQTVRPMSESLKAVQANCVDGSVLFASVLRKIEIDPFLVLVPGHCFLGFYLDEEHKEFELLETTMLGETDPGKTNKEADEIYKDLFGGKTTYLKNWRVFSAAIESGNATYEENKAQLENEKNTDMQYQFIEIDDWRKMGVMPINR